MSQAPEQGSQEQWRKIVQEDDAPIASHWRRFLRHYRKLPRTARIGALTLLLVFVLVAVYAFSPAESSRLQIICQHNFRSAQISVLVDGSVAFSGPLTANTKKRGNILPKGLSAAESFSKVISVSPGKHVVQVHITAPAEGFDQARTVATDVSPEKESILTINATRRNALAVNYEGATVTRASTADEPHSTPRGGMTIVFSILGTMLSASISFLVQEFWRSHKNRMTPSR